MATVWQDLVINGAGASDLIFRSAEPAWQGASGNARVLLELAMPDAPLWADPLGDLDGDGIADLVAISTQGTVLYYGRQEGWDAGGGTLPPDAVFYGWLHSFGDWDGDLAQLVNRYTPEVDTMQTQQVQHEMLLSYGGPDRFGLSVSSGGDANGDGYQDVLILRNPTPDDPVEATLIFGGPEP